MPMNEKRLILKCWVLGSKMIVLKVGMTKAERLKRMKRFIRLAIRFFMKLNLL